MRVSWGRIVSSGWGTGVQNGGLVVAVEIIVGIVALLVEPHYARSDHLTLGPTSCIVDQREAAWIDVGMFVRREHHSMNSISDR